MSMTREEFTQLVRKELPSLRRFLLAACSGNNEEADDVAQIALAFGMNVKALTSKPAEALPAGITKSSLEELLAFPSFVPVCLY